MIAPFKTMRPSPVKSITFFKHNRYRSLLPFHLPQKSLGRWRVKVETRKKGDVLDVVGMRNALFMGLKPTKIKLESDVRIHWLEERGKAKWMSTMPQEIEQHERQLSRFEGRVLVGGLGLGVAIGILENNPRVTKIDVVEISGGLIKLIEPHLGFASKTEIHHRDLYAYLKLAKKLGYTYDYAFYDIWCPTGQMVLDQHVIPLRRLSQDIIAQENIECWNEEEMLGQIRLGLHNLVSMQVVPELRPHGDIAKLRQFYQQSNPQQYPFYNWLITMKPTARYAFNAIGGYVDLLKDPAAFNFKWGKWSKL